MPFHSVIITNLTGEIVFSQFYNITDDPTIRRNLEFEQLLMKNTSALWQTAIKKKSVTIDDQIYVVFQRVGEFLVFVGGVDDIDEPILTDVLTVIILLFTDNLEGGKLLESSFLNSETFGKFQILLDEVIPQGVLESIDVDLISKMGKLKNI